MPNLDKTGPQGLGSMTGRGLGLCSVVTSQEEEDLAEEWEEDLLLHAKDNAQFAQHTLS